jgi:ElaB/YqjD/DUF883 family membrane-anchored ribosome-binding protein
MDQRNDLGMGATGGTSSGGMGTGGAGGSRAGQGGMSETERELERTRDVVAQSAAPALADKTQLGRTAEAVKHDAERVVRERVDEAAGRLEGRANELKDRAAGGLEDAARRIDEMADRHLGEAEGLRGRASNLTHSAADSMESVARYLRTNDVGELQADLEKQVRTRPLQTLLVAVAAGWLVGKVIR